MLTNSKNPPDAILREVLVRSGSKPFARIEDVISPAKLAAICDRYKRVAQCDEVRWRRANPRSASASRG